MVIIVRMLFEYRVMIEAAVRGIVAGPEVGATPDSSKS
jgi:hypothetical protein